MTLKIPKQEILSCCAQIKREQLSRMENYLMFLGHAHSGHSLIGALLDAHPDIAIANELNAPKLVLDHGLSATELQQLTLHYSLLAQRWEGEINTGYKYKVHGGFQGKTKTPKVLGDKKGGGSTRVLRNNKDNIAAFAHYWEQSLGEQHVQRYYENMETVLNLKAKHPEVFHTISHRDFINDPESELKKTLKFLHIESESEFFNACLKVVKTQEHRRSESYHWTEEMLNTIKLKNIQFNLTDY
jgi:hypothetical protein